MYKNRIGKQKRWRSSFQRRALILMKVEWDRTIWIYTEYKSTNAYQHDTQIKYAPHYFLAVLNEFCNSKFRAHEKINYVFLCSCTGSWFPRVGFPSCGRSRGLHFTAVHGFSLQRFLLFWSTSSRAEAQQLCLMSFAAHGTWNLPGPGLNPSPTLVEANFLLLDLQGCPRARFLKVNITLNICWLNR